MLTLISVFDYFCSMKFLGKILVFAIAAYVIASGISRTFFSVTEPSGELFSVVDENSGTISSQDFSDRNYNSFSRACLNGSPVFSFSSVRTSSPAQYDQIKKQRRFPWPESARWFSAYLKNGCIFGPAGAADFRNGDPHFPTTGIQEAEYLFKICTLLT